jgi:hypothetical protein
MQQQLVQYDSDNSGSKSMDMLPASTQKYPSQATNLSTGRNSKEFSFFSGDVHTKE